MPYRREAIQWCEHVQTASKYANNQTHSFFTYTIRVPTFGHEYKGDIVMKNFEHFRDTLSLQQMSVEYKTKQLIHTLYNVWVTI
jgi:hypothetical protein